MRQTIMQGRGEKPKFLRPNCRTHEFCGLTGWVFWESADWLRGNRKNKRPAARSTVLFWVMVVSDQSNMPGAPRAGGQL